MCRWRRAMLVGKSRSSAHLSVTPHPHAMVRLHLHVPALPQLCPCSAPCSRTAPPPPSRVCIQSKETNEGLITTKCNRHLALWHNEWQHRAHWGYQQGTTGQLGHWFGLFDRLRAGAAGASKVQKSPSVESRSLSQNLLEGAVRSD